MTAHDNPEGPTEATPARGRPYRNVRDPRSVSILGIGMIIGAVIGAGVAMLVAPQSGRDTRRAITRRATRLRHRGGAWKQLGRELRRAAAAKRKAMEMEARRQEIRTRKAESASS